MFIDNGFSYKYRITKFASGYTARTYTSDLNKANERFAELVLLMKEPYSTIEKSFLEQHDVKSDMPVLLQDAYVDTVVVVNSTREALNVRL